MNSAQRRTLARVFAQPTPADVRWTEIESMLGALGCEISEGNGSRMRVALKGAKAVFHRPHPQPGTKRSSVRAVRDFLIAAGVRAEDGDA
jgi:hypothetical protein